MTGYTYEIVGKNLSLQQVMLVFARGFLWYMKEDNGAVHPDRLSDDEKGQVPTAKAKLSEWNATGKKIRLALYEKEKIDRKRTREEAIQRRAKENASLKRSIEQINEWIVPTPKHEAIKKFALDQLTSSLDESDVARWYPDAPSFKMWQENRTALLKEDLEYAKERFAEREERVQKNNEWLEQLIESTNVA